MKLTLKSSLWADKNLISGNTSNYLKTYQRKKVSKVETTSDFINKAISRTPFRSINLTPNATIKGENTSFEFDFPNPSEKDQWLIKQDQSFTPSRPKYVVEAFRKEFPHIKVDTNDDVAYKQVTALASRSSAIQEWYAITNQGFGEYAQLPLYYKNLIEPKDFVKLQKEVTKYNSSIASAQQEKQKAAQEYKDKLEKIDKKLEEVIAPMKQNNKILEILTLNTTSLPLTIQLAIENYSPSKNTSEPDQHTYGRELLVLFKKHLIQLVKENPQINLSKVIKDYSTK